MIKENDFFENKEVREKFMERYEILEKVKEVLLIPGTEFATTQQVADFYEVSTEVIKKAAQRNSDELFEDGMISVSGAKIKEKVLVDTISLKKYSGGFSINDIKFANKLNTLFPRRAILRIGMLLRDSEVAKEVRTQLLNIEEKTSEETKTQDINEEQGLMIAVGMAMASGDVEALAVASTKLMEFKNRHIEKLKTDNKALSEGILEWSNRSKINAGIRSLANNANIAYAEAWNKLYSQLNYKYSVNLKARKGRPYIQNIREDEWTCLIKSFAAICEEYNLSATDMISR